MPTTTIQMVDSNDFTVTTTTVQSYSVSDIQGQIATLNEQIAQITANALAALQNDQIAPLQAQITQLQNLLTEAAAQGVTVPDSSTPNAAPITATLQTEDTAALAVASPQAVQETPQDEQSAPLTDTAEPAMSASLSQ